MTKKIYFFCLGDVFESGFCILGGVDTRVLIQFSAVFNALLSLNSVFLVLVFLNSIELRPSDLWALEGC